MAKQIKTRKGKDDYYYPYTSPDLVIDNTGKSATTRFEEIEDNQLNLIEDGTTKGIKDTEYDTLTTTNKTIIGSINELSTQFKDIANLFTAEQTTNSYKIKCGNKVIAEIPLGSTVPTITKYTITNSLSNATNSNSVTEIEENQSYIATITADDRYSISNVVITMGGTNITDSVYSDGNINISNVTGDIVITVVCVEIINPTGYSITNNLTRTSTSNTDISVEKNTSYTTTLTPTDDAILYDTSIIMGGVDITKTVLKNNVITISEVTGDVVINATSHILGNPVFSVDELSLNAGDSTTLTVTLDKTPTVDQVVNLDANYNLYQDAVVTPSNLTFNANNTPTAQSITLSLTNNSERYCNNNTRLIAKSNKITDKEINVAITIPNVYDKNSDNIPLDNVIFNFSPNDIINLPKSQWSDYRRCNLYDKWNNETNELHEKLLNIFYNFSKSKNTKLLDLIKQSTCLSYISVNHKGCYSFLGDKIVFQNEYGSEYGWNCWYARSKMSYKNTSDEIVSMNFNSDPIDMRTFNTPTLGYETLAFSLCSNGQIKFYFKNTLIYTIDTPSDFKAWNFDVLGVYNIRACSNCANLDATSNFIYTTDEITIDDLTNYYNYYIQNEKTQNINSLDTLNLQPGDSAEVYTEALPTYLNRIVSKQILDNSIATVDNNIVTGVSNGTTTLACTSDDITKNIEVNVGQQITSNCVSNINDDRDITDIVLVETPIQIYINQEYPVYCIGVNNSADLPYTVQTKNLLTYSSNNTNVCTVEYGVLKGRGVGTAIITVSNLTKTINKTFTVNVIEEPIITYQNDEILNINPTTYNISIDKTNSQNTTTGIQTALTYAKDNNYKKVVFPQGEYLVNRDYGEISIPSNMEIDWSNSNIYLELGTQSVQGCNMFLMSDCINTILRNVTFYGESYTQTGGHTSNTSLTCNGISKHCKIINCHFLYSPGFNVSIHYTRKAIVGFKLSNIEVGGLNDNGDNDNRTANVYRSKDYINISSIGNTIGLGNMQGFQGYMYMSARLYDLYFFDENKTFISKLKYCVQYQQYDKPSNSKYVKIAFYQDFIPTKSDPDYASIAHLYTATQPTDILFKDCSFKYAVMTGISPQGGIRLTLDNCTFLDNGSSDPYSHIDWEDGRTHIQGHIIRNCTFNSTNPTKWHSNIAMLNGRDIVFHDNKMSQGQFYLTGEMQNARIYRNQFINTKVSLASKTDMCYVCNINKGTLTESIDLPTMQIIKDGNKTFN